MDHIKAGEAKQISRMFPQSTRREELHSAKWRLESLKFGCKPRLSKAVTWGQSRHIGHQAQAQPGDGKGSSNIYDVWMCLLPDVFHFLIRMEDILLFSVCPLCTYA